MGSLEVMVILGVKTFGLQSSCSLRLGNPNTIPIMVLHLFGFFCFLSCVMQEKLYSKTHGCCQYKLEGGSIPLTNLVIVEFVFNVFISKIGFQQFSLIVGAHILMQLVDEFKLDVNNVFPFWIGLVVDKVVCHDYNHLYFCMSFDVFSYIC